MAIRQGRVHAPRPRPHQSGDEFVEGGHQRPYDEHLVVLLDAVEDAYPGRAVGLPACGFRVGRPQPVVEFTVLGGELVQRPGEHHASGVEDGDLGAQRLQVVHVMAGEHHARALRGEPVENTVHVSLSGRIKAVGGFVEHEQPGSGEQGGGEPEPLPHAEGETAGLVVGDIGEPDLVEHVVDPRGPRVLAPEAGQRGEVLPGGERRIQTGRVHEPRDTVRHGERPLHRRAQDLQPPAVGDGQPQQQAEQGRLPGAVRSHQTMDVTLCHIQVDAVECHDLAEAPGDPAGPDRVECVHEAPSLPEPSGTLGTTTRPGHRQLTERPGNGSSNQRQAG